MNYQTIEVQMGDAVAVIWLNRPEVRNAFNEILISELTAALKVQGADPSVRAVVLAGRGSAFCAGADLNWMKKMAGYGFEENHADALTLANMLHTLHTLPKPTVARVHGAAFAGGLGLIAACDIAVASQDAEFCVSEVKIGLAPATISPYLLAAIGERHAHRYFLTAERFTAAEAYRIGLVQELAIPEELDATVNGILGHLVQAGPHALAATKDLIRSVARSKLNPELLADTATRIATIRASEEGKEGVRSFLEKRRAAWVPAAVQGAKGARSGKKGRKS